MSIKGNFSDISFAELLKIISKYNGRLGVWNFQSKKQYECFLQNENVVYVNINGQNVIDAETINTCLSELSCDKQSYYAFQKDAILDSKPQMNLAVSKILSTTVLSNTRSEELEQLLPNILTKFEIVPEFNGNLSGELSSFWDLAIAHFHMGCSPSDLADLFGMNIRDVQLSFYKLRTVRAIKPVRLFNVNKASAKAKSAGVNLQRLVNMRNGVKTTPLSPSSLPPTVSINQESMPLALSADIEETPLMNDNSVLDKKSFDNFELDKTIQIPNNDHFLNKYMPAVSPINTDSSAVNNNQNTISKTEEANNNTAVPNKQPIFDLNSGIVRQGIVKRMLSSLFSRKAH